MSDLNDKASDTTQATGKVRGLIDKIKNIEAHPNPWINVLIIVVKVVLGIIGV